MTRSKKLLTAAAIGGVVPALMFAGVGSVGAASSIADDQATSASTGKVGRTRPAIRADILPDHVPGELVVRFRAGIPATRRHAIVATIHARTVRTLSVPGVRLLNVPGSVAAAAGQLERNPAVRYAEPNYLYQSTAMPDDPEFAQLWGLDNTGQVVQGQPGVVDADIDAVEAWDTVKGDRSVTVGLVDTGVAYDHPDLVANMWTNTAETPNGVDDDHNGRVDDVRGWDWVDDDGDPRDLNGHGTHVAGTIGAAGDNGSGVTGVSQQVSIMPLRVLGPAGGTNADIAEAFAYAAMNGADVVNASLGGTEYSQAMADAITTASDTLFVVSAGNTATNNQTSPLYPCNYPARNLLCVAATDNRDQLASFSNYGSHVVDMAAPGVSILSTAPDEEALFTDDFEDAADWTGRWVTGGTSSWGVRTDVSRSYLSDSPVGPYSPYADTWVQTATPLDLTGGRGCSLNYQLNIDTEWGYDPLRVEASTNGQSWVLFDAWWGTSGYWFGVRDSLAQFEGSSSVRLRFRLTSDGSVQRDGVSIDDVEVSCINTSYDGDEYAYMHGTSMAAPHVSGAAALLFALEPAASVARVRNALLGGAEPKSALYGRVATGGRLNVNNSLSFPPNPDNLTPQTTMVSGPPGSGYDRTASLSFSSNEQEAAFECALDDASYAECTSPQSYPGLVPGPHRFRVRAVDAAGNRDLTPAEWLWVVQNAAPSAVDVTGIPVPFITQPTVAVRPRGTDIDGVAYYEVRSRIARFGGTFGPYQTIAGSVADTAAATVSTRPGFTMCFCARATDTLGATSAWSPGRCTAVPADDRQLTKSPGWTTGSGSAYYQNTYTSSARRGANLSARVTQAKHIALLATKAPGAGTATVSLGSTLLERVSLSATATRHRVLIPITSWRTARSGTIKISIRTANRPVRIDGLAIGRM